MKLYFGLVIPGREKYEMKTPGRKQKYILVFVCAFLAIFMLNSCLPIHLAKKESNLWSQVDNCTEFREDWQLWSIEDMKDEKSIIVTFHEKNRPRNFSKTKEIVEEIKECLFSSQYTYADEGYRIDVDFTVVGVSSLKICDITPPMDEISISSSVIYADEAPIKKLAEWFPNVVSITTDNCCEDNLEDLKMFRNLEKVQLTNGITQEEKEQILSIFPDIDLDNTKIKDE